MKSWSSPEKGGSSHKRTLTLNYSFWHFYHHRHKQ